MEQLTVVELPEEVRARAERALGADLAKEKKNIRKKKEKVAIFHRREGGGVFQ